MTLVVTCLFELSLAGVVSLEIEVSVWSCESVVTNEACTLSTG